ncbi:MAG: hypothetical protein U0Z75_07500 [Deinococcaceae bacterium]
MAYVEFFDHDSQTFSFEDSDTVRQMVARVSSWADVNTFDRIVFWRDPLEPHKLFVQLGDDRLGYWIHESTFTDGKQDIEAQLDYARGAQRREAAGYGRFDR